MAPRTRIPPERWIEEGLRALALGGPQAVRVEVLARALGVTKGGFYNHFANRVDLLENMLDTWETTGVDEVIARAEREGGEARDKLRSLFAVADSSGQLLKTEASIREWAQRDRAVAQRLERVDTRRMDYLRTLFCQFIDDDEEVEVRALLAFSLFIGVPSIAAKYPKGRRVEVVRLTQEHLLKQ